jgi:hypothetical protein
MLSAQAAGYTGQLELLPDPDTSRLVGRVRNDAVQPAESHLHRAIGQRHVNRGAYDPRHAAPGDVIAEP